MPDNVRDTFDQIRQFVKNDIGILFAAERGGNYAAALLVAVACESLSRLLGRPTTSMLTGLFTKHDVPEQVALGIATALRNGVAHIYDTLFIQAGELRLELIISWGAREHLTVRRDPPGIYLNARTMWEDLQAVFEALRKELPAGGPLLPQWIAESVHHVDGRETRLWREWFQGAEKG